jgi:enoyl-CoA hydratase/carnithine racemase
MSHYEMAGLIELVGKSVALEILFEGRIFDAEEAYAKGLLNKVVAEKELDNELKLMVERICEGAPLVNRWHKRFARRIVQGLSSGKPLSEDELMEGYECFDTSDFQEGYNSFIEKRSPKFNGR